MTQLIERYPLQTRVATAVTVIAAIVILTVGFTKREDSMLARLTVLECDYAEGAIVHEVLENRIEANRATHHSTALELVKINTKLAAIEGLLLDIKQGS